MSLSRTPHICLSCRHTAAWRWRYPRIARDSNQSRRLTYTQQERQKVARRQTSSKGDEGDSEMVFVESAKYAVPLHPIGRYSRKPLTATMIPRKDLTAARVLSQFDTLYASKLMLPSRIAGGVRLNQPISAFEAERDHGSGARTSLRRTLLRIRRLVLVREYKMAWNHLLDLKKNSDWAQKETLKDISAFDNDIQELAVHQVDAWFVQNQLHEETTLLDGSVLHSNTHHDIAMLPQEKQPMSQEATAGAETVSVPRIRGLAMPLRPSNPLLICETLLSLNMLSSQALLSILCATLRGVLAAVSTYPEQRIHTVMDQTLQDVVRIWHLVLAQHLAKHTPDQSIQATSQGADTEWDWSFLPTAKELDNVTVLNPRSMKEALAMYVPVGKDSNRMVDYVSAAAMTTFFLEASFAKAESQQASHEIHAAYGPFQAFLSKLISARPADVAPRLLQRIYQDLDADGKLLVEQICQAVAIPTGGLVLNQPKGQAKEDAKSRSQWLEDKMATGDDATYRPIEDQQPSIGGTQASQQQQHVIATATQSEKTVSDHKEHVQQERRPPPQRAAPDFLTLVWKRSRKAVEAQNAGLADQVLKDVIQYIETSDLTDAKKTDVCDATVIMYARLDRFKRAVQFMDWMQQHGISISKKAWTSLLRGTARLDDSNMVNHVWDIMLRRGVLLDAPLWSARLLALMEQDRYAEALQAMESMGFAWDDHLAAAASRLAEEQTRAASLEYNDKTPSPTLVIPAQPTIAVANTMLSTLVKKRTATDVLDAIQTVLRWIKKYDLVHDINTWNPLLRYASRRGDVKEIFEMLAQFKEEGIKPNAETGGILADAVLRGDYLRNMKPEEQTAQILEIMDDIEQNHINGELDSRGYAMVIDRMLTYFKNRGAAERLMSRMRRSGMPMTAHIYTSLLMHVLSGPQPDLAAFEALWYNIKHSEGVWGAVDAFFFDRALERLCHYHHSLGIDKIVDILNHLPQMKVRPSWSALLDVAQVFMQRGDHERFKKLINNLRTSVYVMPQVEGRGYGHGMFWDYVFSTGLLAKEGIQTYRQMWEIDRKRKYDNFQSRSRAETML